MITIVGWTWVLGACVLQPPSADPPRSDRWVEVEPGKDLCLPGFPAQRGLSRRAARSLVMARAALERADLVRALQALEPVPEQHPAARATHAVAQLMGQEAEAPARTLLALLSDHPTDPCLASSAALAVWASGDPTLAEQLLRRALDLAPEDGHIAFLAWFLGVERAGALRPALERGLAAQPGHVGMGLAVGVADLEAGDLDAAWDRLRAAAAAGMPEADAPLLQAAFRRGAWDDYLRAASRLGLPLGDAGAIATAEEPWDAYAEVLRWQREEPLMALIDTTEGPLRCTLAPELAPVTVANFVGLARGTLAWRDPRSGDVVRDPLYPGTELHRVVPGFMVQGGDPLGTGTGGPGYTFLDEVSAAARFDRPGMLAMANRGAHTNGSQFFVTSAPAPHLDGGYTIFGQCDEASVRTVRAIMAVPLEGTRPVSPVVLRSVEIR